MSWLSWRSLMEGGSEQKVGKEYDVVRVTNAIMAKVSPLMSSTTLQHPLVQCPAGRVFQYRVGSGRVLNKIPGSGSGSGRVRVSKNTNRYFRVSFFLSGISGYFGYFRVCRVFLGISGFTHIY